VTRPGVFSRNEDRIERRREAARRLKIANAVLRFRRLELREWQRGSYILSTATGRERMFESLAHLWPETEALAAGGFDPLDPRLLDHLRALS
jgi:hypothetical protein